MKPFKFLFLCIALVVAAVTSGPAQSNLVLFVSSPGDYIGHGQTDVTTNPADFSLSGTASLITVNAFGYTFWIGGPGRTNLKVGTYTNSARYPFNGSQPGLDVFGNGRGCNTDCGSFEVHELHTNTSGQVDRLWVTFTNQCECSMSPMMGDIRYNSQLAPPAPVPRTIRVPVDYPSIQAAIDAASVLTTDTIQVFPGVYNESVNFNGKGVHLVSSEGPALTWIEPPPGSSAVVFNSGETTNSVISGFTITNAGISVSSSSPLIISNILVNCGTGVNDYFGSPVIENNSITGCSGSGIYLGAAGSAVVQGNIIQNNGGGIGMNASGSPFVANNLIQNNNGDAISGVNGCDINVIQNIIAYNAGSALSFLVPSGSRGPVAVNNTMVGNTYGVSISGYDGASKIINNIIVGKNAVNISYFNSSDVPIFQNNDIFSWTGNPYTGALTNLAGINGNISTNPFFACVPGGDFHLLAGSPCIDAGTSGAPYLPATDFDGLSRILASITNGPILVDMGAFEFNPAFPPSPCLYLNVPTNIVVVANAGQSSAVVNYPVPDATPTATVICQPPSGSIFPAGTNVVVCTLVYGTNVLTGTFNVTVLVPPYITNQPTVLSVVANSRATLAVDALGTPPLSYQWAFNGNAIAGATNSTLTVANTQSVNEGYYRVTLANGVGTATSQPIALRVLPAAAQIVSGPDPLTVPAGSQAVFNASVLGSAPLSFQWYKDGAVLPGATTSQLTISNAQTADAGTYQLQVSNYLGTAVSTGAALTVTPAAPTFILQPLSTVAVAGSNAEFNSLAAGTDDGLNPIHYAWYFQSNRITGQTGPDLALSSITAANQGSYYVVAANTYGTATSDVAQLTVYLPPALSPGLSNQVVDAGKTIVLNASAAGTPPLTYNWKFNYTGITNHAASLALTNIAPSQSGFYSVTVTNQYGSASSTGRVSVFPAAAQVVAWGDDSGGQTNVPANLDDAVAIAGGDYHSIAIRHDGTLIGWGFDDAGQIDVPTNSLRFVSIAAGADHNLAILENGQVIGWGLNASGQTDVPANVTSAIGVAAGDSHSLALLSSGQVIAWGNDSYGQTDLPSALTPGGYWEYSNGQYVWVTVDPPPAQAIAARGNHSLVLLTNGTVAAWGDNSFGQSSPPPGLSNVVAVAAGDLHSAALCSNGMVVAWGDNTFGQTNVPPGLSNVVAIAAGDFDTLALQSNGVVVGWGDDTFGELNVPASVTDALTLASGDYHGLALVPLSLLLQADLTSGGLVIHWNGTGTLQWASKPAGPYTDVPGQGNTWTNLDMSAPAKFFRLRH